MPIVNKDMPLEDLRQEVLEARKRSIHGFSLPERYDGEDSNGLRWIEHRFIYDRLQQWMIQTQIELDIREGNENPARPVLNMLECIEPFVSALHGDSNSPDNMLLQLNNVRSILEDAQAWINSRVGDWPDAEGYDPIEYYYDINYDSGIVTRRVHKNGVVYTPF